MRVAFECDGQRYEADLLARGTKNARVGWLGSDVPATLANRVEPSLTRPGWMTILLPLVGPRAVAIDDVMDAEITIKRRQAAWAASRGIPLQMGNPKSSGEALYTYSLDANLFEPLGPDATSEFEQGDGTPLQAKNGSLPHLWALHNSDAIAVNVFGYWKARDCQRVARYLEIPENGIASVTFEKKFRILPQGTKPNIDVAIGYSLGSELEWVGVESKLTETYPAKPRKLFD